MKMRRCCETRPRNEKRERKRECENELIAGAIIGNSKGGKHKVGG